MPAPDDAYSTPQVKALQAATGLRIFGPFTLAVAMERAPAGMRHPFDDLASRFQAAPSAMPDAQLMLNNLAALDHNGAFWQQLAPIHEAIMPAAAPAEEYIKQQLLHFIGGLAGDQLLSAYGNRLTHETLQRKITAQSLSRYIGADAAQSVDPDRFDSQSHTGREAARARSPRAQAAEAEMRHQLLEQSIQSALELFTIFLKGGNPDLANQLLDYAVNLRAQQQALEAQRANEREQRL